jgi:pimeloyl-ACP methyl ester carboxylesterase
MLRRGGLAFERGGNGGPLLVLIHGLGATAGVWSAMLAEPCWQGRWIAPDLPGHGRSDHGGDYSVGAMAAAIGDLIEAERDGEEVIILGHSLGGLVAIALAGTALPVRAAHGLGIKVDWSDEELQRFAGLAARPPKLFDSETEALAQHRRLCGLGEVAPDSPLLARGVAMQDGQWRAAMDMAAFAVERPRMAERVAAARCPVRLACGEGDAMISAERLRDFDPEAFAIGSAGHNAMVDAPGAVWNWLQATP